MDLTWIFPEPEPIRVGARTLMASPLRLRDLARLQSYLKSAEPCPLDAARPAILAADDGSEARRRILRDTYNACKEWPRRLGSDEGQAILNSDDGFRFWISAVLGPDNPGMTREVVEELAESMTVGQYQNILRVAYGAAPLEELSRMITPDSFPDGEAEYTNWGKVIRAIIVETGWTFEQCGDLRLTQLAAFQTDGKAGSGRVDPPPGMSRFQFSKRQKRFFGPDRNEEGSNGHG